MKAIDCTRPLSIVIDGIRLQPTALGKRKQAMTKATLLATVLCAAIATQASARFSANHVELTGSTAQDLQGDTIYDVSENRTITAEAG
ncbi:MAG: hypothetical protein IJL06_10585, partial [Kiritimatiellae bacterium]|nr:hypothetical protein [Kiritimatiellia bacterium]